MSKRSAGYELNHDNWDDEDKPEDAGSFLQASPEALKGRVIRTARRRGIGLSTTSSGNDSSEDPPKNIFASFSGFSKSENNTSSSKAVFSFLSSSSNGKTISTDIVPVVGQESKNPAKSSSNGVDNSVTSTDSSVVESNDGDYYRKLKGLNEGVSKWIQTHVSNNPFCILTPVFRDYEKHLANIQNVPTKEDVDCKKDNTSTAESIIKGEKTENISQEKSVSDVQSNNEIIGSKGNEEKPSFSSSIFGSTNSSSTASATFSFGSSSITPAGSSQSGFGSKSIPSPNNAPIFSFGAGGTSSPSAGFSFGTGKPFLFGNVAKPQTVESKEEEEDEEDTPPKSDHKPVNEEGAMYTKRCKMFVKNESRYSERGVGNLFLKPVEGGKTQLIVRADTSLGNVLLNILLGPSLPVQKVGNKDVAIVYMPPPAVSQDSKQEENSEGKPITALLRVKTSEDADDLFKTLEKYKKLT